MRSVVHDALHACVAWPPEQLGSDASFDNHHHWSCSPSPRSQGRAWA